MSGNRIESPVVPRSRRRSTAETIEALAVRVLRVRFTVRRMMLAVVICGTSIVLLPSLFGHSRMQAALIGSGLSLGVLFDRGGGHWPFFLGAISGMIALGGAAWLALPPRPIGAHDLLKVLLDALFGALIGAFLGGQLSSFLPSGQPDVRDR